MLRVSGGRPLHLRGHLLAEASSWSPGAPAWHEMALYQCDGGEIVAALRFCTQPAGAGDLCQARPFATLADAADWLGGIDATADIAIDLDASDRRLSGVEIALRAAALRQRADRVERQYKAMIGELLFCIEAARPPGGGVIFPKARCLKACPAVPAAHRPATPAIAGIRRVQSEG